MGHTALQLTQIVATNRLFSCTSHAASRPVDLKHEKFHEMINTPLSMLHTGK